MIVNGPVYFEMIKTDAIFGHVQGAYQGENQKKSIKLQYDVDIKIIKSKISHSICRV